MIILILNEVSVDNEKDCPCNCITLGRLFEAVPFILLFKPSFGYCAENMFALFVRCDDFIENAFSSLTEQMFCGGIIVTNR